MVLLVTVFINFNLPKKVAGSTGLEPAASGVTGRRSNQTELRPLESGEMVGDTRIELVTYGL